MQNFFGVEIDTANMTLEELKEAQAKTRQLLANLTYQIKLRQTAEHRHHSSDVSPR